jgi:hypothetical protein
MDERKLGFLRLLAEHGITPGEFGCAVKAAQSVGTGGIVSKTESTCHGNPLIQST